MKKIFFIIFLGILTLSPMLSLAAGLVPCGGQGEHVCQLCDFFVLFNNIINFILKDIVPPIAVLMIAIGGFMYLFAYFSPSQALSGGKGGPALLSQAKKLMSSVIIGLIIIFGAWVFVNTFFQLIGVQEWTGLSKGWWQINCSVQ